MYLNGSFLQKIDILVVLVTIVLLSGCSPKNSSQENKIVNIPTPHKLNQFGLQTDSLISKQEKIKRNETLGLIFSRFNLGDNVIFKIRSSFSDVFNMRKIVAGKKYYTYSTADSINKLQYFVYQRDPINYVVIDLTDSVMVYEGAKEVKIKRKTLTGVIDYSLYQTISESEADPELLYRLSKVYAWQIDFFRLQKGDNFKIIYEEKFVDNKPAGINKIVAAEFFHYGETFYAFRFDQDNEGEFFDEEGNSLMKAFLKAPLDYSRISSRFSRGRYHPILKRRKAHLGTDYAAPTGTPIYSVGDGIVTAASYTGGNGRYVKIRHNSVYSTQYLHMSRFAKGVRSGVSVKQGQVIGYVGSTGLATGPHLCYRFWKNGVQIDPFREKIPPSHPVKKENLETYNKLKVQLQKELDQINIAGNPPA